MESGGECLFVHLDVTSESSWQEAVASAVARFGKLDVLVNNAGIFRTEGVLETSEALWDEMLEINGKGVFLGTKCAIPEMRKAGGGSIINISSVAGLVGGPGSAAYRASKGAVRLFTKATAIQYAGDGIRANSVHPGIIETPMTTPNLLADEAARQRAIAPGSLGQVRPARRRGQWGIVLGQRRVFFRHRQRAGDRRRRDRPITAAAVTHSLET